MKIWTYTIEYHEEDLVMVAEKGYKSQDDAMAQAADDMDYALQDVDDPQWTLDAANWTSDVMRGDQLLTTRVDEIAATITVYAIEVE